MGLSGSALVVHAEAEAASELAAQLTGLGMEATCVSSASEALRVLGSELVHVALVDVRLSTPKGTVVEQISERWPDVGIVGVVQGASASNVMQAMRAGAADAIARDADDGEVKAAVERAIASAGSEAEGPPPSQLAETGLIGQTPLMHTLREQIARAAAGTATVLVRGESGTGKELVARGLHSQSVRRGRPFIKVHCAGLPETLLESELFGHEKGAFTGAVSRKPGRVEVAGDGTLFLDEIGDISPSVQIKLLRLIQDREYERLGSNDTLKTEARFIAATHRDLETLIKEGTFREDLFYRLNVVRIWVAPLRARREDVDFLARRFFDGFAEENGRGDLELADDAVEELRKQRWPGNVRQLQNLVERLVTMTEANRITAHDVKRELSDSIAFKTQTFGLKSGRPSTSPNSVAVPLADHLHAAEKEAIARALERAGGSRTKAARLLGIGRTTLYNKMVEHGLLERSGS